jgi:hypothetical protein
MRRRLLLSFAVIALALAQPAHAQTPPFNECPAVGSNTSCRILIVIDTQGSLRVLEDPNAAPTFDDQEDTLVGVLNLYSKPISSIPLSSASAAIFGFDGDGICGLSPNTAAPYVPVPPGCPFGSTGYEGPGVTFSSISANQQSGVVNFNPPLPTGGTAYFSLESAIGTQCPAITSVPRLLEASPPWGSETYDSTTGTIADYGSVVTSLAMLINYYASSQLLSFHTDPGVLNTYLTGNSGFLGVGVLNPLTAAQYARNNGVGMYFQGFSTVRNDFTLDSYVCSGNPPLLNVGTPAASHWVVATGQDTVSGNLTYDINDPGSDLNTTLQAFGFSYSGLALFTSAPTTPAGLFVVVHSPVDLLITDPNGLMTGLDPTTGTILTQIPGSSYFSQALADDLNNSKPTTPLAKILYIPAPASGTYTIQVLGTGNGSYEIDIASYDDSGTPTTHTYTGVTETGVTSEIVIQYSSTPGTPTKTTVYCPGDVNKDGTVNSTDLVLVRAAFGASKGAPGYSSAADVNNDGIVNILDLALVSRNLGCKAQTQ